MEQRKKWSNGGQFKTLSKSDFHQSHGHDLDQPIPRCARRANLAENVSRMFNRKKRQCIRSNIREEE
jgi:hypothetical protein